MLDEEILARVPEDHPPAPAVPARPWQRGGPSPNPTGRPKDPMRQLARDKSQAALEVVAKIMADETENSQARLTAARMILDRAWGCPVSMTAEVTADGEDKPVVSESALLRFGNLILQAEEQRASRERAGLLPAPTAGQSEPFAPGELDRLRRLAFLVDQGKRQALTARQAEAIETTTSATPSDDKSEERENAKED